MTAQSRIQLNVQPHLFFFFLLWKNKVSANAFQQNTSLLFHNQNVCQDSFVLSILLDYNKRREFRNSAPIVS